IHSRSPHCRCAELSRHVSTGTSTGADAEQIRFFAAHHGVTNLYHETLTTFWMRLLEHVASTGDVDPSRRSGNVKADLPLWRRINLIVDHWTKRRPVEAHYSTELIKSQAARA